MKSPFKTKAQAVEIGAGLGLITVSLTFCIIDSSMLPYMGLNVVLGFLISTGLLSDKRLSTKSCSQKVSTEK
jgi:hypothetical protein